MENIVESCRFLLENYPGAKACKDYLDTRLKPESQERFGFGYFPGAMDLNVITDMLGEETLIKNNLLYYKMIEDHVYGPRNVPVSYFEQHPLIMPFRNTYGEVVALVGRSFLSEDERKLEKLAKYKNTKETKSFKKGNLLFGLYENRDSIMRENCVYVVEGQFDVIKAVEKGFTNIVALGTNSMTPYQFSVISRYWFWTSIWNNCNWC